MNNELKRRGIRFFYYILIFTAFFILGFLVYTRISNESIEFSKSQTRFDSDIFESFIEKNLEKIDGVSSAVGGSPWAWPLFINPSAENIASANSVLDRYKKIFDISVIYLIDKKGNTLASSNRNDADSFVGSNYSFRPYFKEAISGKTYRYVALGVTSQKYGYYVSNPIIHDGEIVGVVAVKQDADKLLTPDLQILFRDELLILDKSGIVIFSNNLEYISKSIWPLDSGELALASEQNRLGLVFVDPILETKTDNLKLVNLHGDSFYFVRSSPHDSEIDSVYFHSAAQSQRIRISLLFSLAFLGLFVMALLLIFERNLRTKQIIFQKEERFRELAEISKDWVWEMDKNGNYIYTNISVKDVLGYEPKEIIGRSYKDFLKNVEEFASDEDSDKERHIHIHKNGSEVIMESYKKIIKDPFGKIIGIRGLDKDVTQKEKEKRETGQQLLEVSRLNKLMIDRELKMVELKKELEELKNKQ